MAKDTHELYKGPTLHKIFAVSSILFVMGVVWMVFQDYHREWKQFQRDFEVFEREKTEKEVERAERKLDDEMLASLEKDLAAQRALKEQNKSSFKAITHELEEVEEKLFKIKQSQSIAKSYYDSAKYEFEEARKHGEADDAMAEHLEALKQEADEWDEKLENIEFDQKGLVGKIASFTADERRIESEIKRLTRSRDQLVQKVEKLKPSLVKTILNAPMLDFIRPTLSINQIVTEDLYDDYHFAKVPKVDRCTTCHLAIDKPKGYKNAPQPFRSHPNLELFLGGQSPHPIEAFGCTSCHSGSGQDITFSGAAHMPRSDAQAAEWKEKYGWKERTHWEEKMYPVDRIEASCVKCHDAFQEIPHAPKLNAGRRLYRELGCFGCHETKGFEGLRKVGPSLERIGNKTDPGWAFKWIKNPLSFNKETRMPRFYGLPNAAPPDREDVEVDAIVTYLFEHSEADEIEKSEKRGDADHGEMLVKSVGCLGCHSIGDQAANEFGPNLSWVGSKVNRSWLIHWLKNPKAHWTKTRMPGLRLSDDEARDMAEYLMSLKNAPFEQIAEPVIDAELLHEATRYEMNLLMTEGEAEAMISGMDERAKKLYLGERVIARTGCFACHDIPGFENAKPIGTNMSEEGSKPISRFDFALLDLPHSREAWFAKKLEDPRAFDAGKIKRHEERARMPKFNLTEDEIQSLVTHLVSLTGETVPLSKKHILDAREQKIEEGWRLVREFNCQGCHIVEGEGGRILELYEDKSLGPPNITGEGAKVQSDWLFNFLRHPSTIRPWLNIRMPTFHFTDEQAAKLVKFFHSSSHIEDPFLPDDVARVSPDQLSAGKAMFESLQCINCHKFTEGSKLGESVDVSTLAPNLGMARHRLRSEWVVDWLNDPEALMPGTRMPSFWPDGYSPLPEFLDGDSESQRVAVRDYVMNMDADTSPAVASTAVQ